jgi:hypothetical protein
MRTQYNGTGIGVFRIRKYVFRYNTESNHIATTTRCYTVLLVRDWITCLVDKKGKQLWCQKRSRDSRDRSLCIPDDDINGYHTCIFPIYSEHHGIRIETLNAEQEHHPNKYHHTTNFPLRDLLPSSIECLPLPSSLSVQHHREQQHKPPHVTHAIVATTLVSV